MDAYAKSANIASGDIRNVIKNDRMYADKLYSKH